ncbi:MAG: hypothetical protein Q9203_005083 [Teloschistes exilis]
MRKSKTIPPVLPAGPEASNKGQPSSIDFAPRYPEPIAQPTAPNLQNPASSHQPFADTPPVPNPPEAYRLRTSSNTPSVSGILSASPAERQRGCMSAPQDRRHADLSATCPAEPQSSHTPQRYSVSQKTSSVDSEKARYVPTSASSGFHPHYAHSGYALEDEELVKEHTVWILIYLSFLSPMIATLVSVYTLFTTLALLLLSPLSLCCRTCQPLRHQFQKYLTPPIDLQLGLIFSTHVSDSNSFNKQGEQEWRDSNVFLLILINVLSPIYAAGIAVASWVAAGFWFTALILGNPDGRDARDDGRAAVLGVKNLWEKWLRRGLR